jgi:hypothetical protein
LIVITFLLRRRPELSAAEFHEYWRDRHGPLVASQAGALGIRRYIQLHCLGGGLALGSRGGSAQLADGRLGSTGWRDLS